MEMTGSQNKLQAFVELMADYEILELARTGITGLSRGSDDCPLPVNFLHMFARRVATLLTINNFYEEDVVNIRGGK